jgi:hypothetical protein
MASWKVMGLHVPLITVQNNEAVEKHGDLADDEVMFLNGTISYTKFNPNRNRNKKT